MADAIHTGNLPALKRLLARNPGLAQTRLGDDQPGGVIGGDPPLADATAIGQWKAARRLVEWLRGLGAKSAEELR